jgi:hypothetical protein
LEKHTVSIFSPEDGVTTQKNDVNLIVAQLRKKCPVFYETREFVVVSMLVFRVVTPCSLVGRDQHSRLELCRYRQYVHRKGWYLPACLHGVTTQKTTAVRKTNLVHGSAHSSLLLVPILRQMKPVHTAASPSSCVTFRNVLVLYGEELLAPAESPCWRTNPCRLSAKTLSIYSQLSISGGRLLHLLWMRRAVVTSGPRKFVQSLKKRRERVHL